MWSYVVISGRVEMTQKDVCIFLPINNKNNELPTVHKAIAMCCVCTSVHIFSSHGIAITCLIF